jgi:electron transfer flavoprotein alpha subunit
VIVAVAEQQGGRLNRASWEAVAAAQRLADLVPRAGSGRGVSILVLGAEAGSVARELAGADVDEVRVLEHEALEPYTADGFAQTLAAYVGRTAASHVVLPHTYQTRDFAPRAAARLRRPLLADVTTIAGGEGGVTFRRPMFQGKLAADVRPRAAGVVFVSVQIGAFRADSARTGPGAPVVTERIELDAAGIRQRPEAPFREARQAVDLGQAERIVAVGRGIKAKDHLPLAERLAAALGAELAASRPICDSGWLPMERQVGSSGQTVAPKLYLALGISGAIQHVVGMKGARTIVAVNKDADAPIFEVADYGIVGDLFEIVPALTAELEKAT